MTADPSAPRRAAPSPLAWASVALVFAVGVGLALVGAELAGVTDLLDRPAPAAVPAPAGPAEIGRLVDQGWEASSVDEWAKASRLFRAALELDPEHDGAHYGYGYAALMDGRTAEAVSHLCLVRDAEERDIRLEVVALLETNGLRCP